MSVGTTARCSPSWPLMASADPYDPGILVAGLHLMNDGRNADLAVHSCRTRTSTGSTGPFLLGHNDGVIASHEKPDSPRLLSHRCHSAIPGEDGRPFEPHDRGHARCKPRHRI